MSNSYNRKDHLYHRAKEEGYRSRAAYKLIELNQHYKLISAGDKVLDLGAWPGGWLQVAANLVGTAGLVVGIDLVAIESLDIPHVKTIEGDVRDDSSQAAALELARGKYDLVMSDMSPKLTGIAEADRAGSVACAELALWTAQQLLKDTGALLIKVFKSNETEQFVRSSRPFFTKISRTELDATRKSSNEFYLVCQGYKSDAGV